LKDEVRRGDRHATDLGLHALNLPQVLPGDNAVACASKVEDRDGASSELGLHIDRENGLDASGKNRGPFLGKGPGEERTQSLRGVTAEEGLDLGKERQEAEEKRARKDTSPRRHERNWVFDERGAKNHGHEAFGMLRSRHQGQGA
jgi:hypothetical protein